LRTNYTVVQALRGIAALWVVLFHASDGNHIPTLKAALPNWVNVGVFDAGHYGVAIFFALSGFVIAHSLSGARITAGYYGRFLLRRSIRLDPAYWVSMILVVALAYVSARVKHESFSAPSLPQIAAHMAYLQSILGFPQINTVYWTLTYEVQFYAFFALLLMVGGRWRYQAMLVLALLSAFGVFDTIHPGIFLNLWGAFFIGVIARYSLDRPRWAAALLVLAIALIGQSTFGAFSAFTAIFLWIAARSGWGEKGMNWKWIQFLGAISYSLYLIHNPVSGATGFIVHRVMGDGIVADIAAIFSICVTSIIAAWMLWFLIERPSHILSRKISLSKRGGSEIASQTAD